MRHVDRGSDPGLRSSADQHEVGPSADDPVALLGNYNGISSRQVTPLEGNERQFPAAEVRYALGATYTAATPALVPSTFLAPPDGKGQGLLAEYFDKHPRLSKSLRTLIMIACYSGTRDQIEGYHPVNPAKPIAVQPYCLSLSYLWWKLAPGYPIDGGFFKLRG